MKRWWCDVFKHFQERSGPRRWVLVANQVFYWQHQSHINTLFQIKLDISFPEFRSVQFILSKNIAYFALVALRNNTKKKFEAIETKATYWSRLLRGRWPGACVKATQRTKPHKVARGMRSACNPCLQRDIQYFASVQHIWLPEIVFTKSLPRCFEI